MLGQPDSRGAELSIANWHCAEDCARELAVPLRVAPGFFLAGTTASDDESDESGEDGILWARVSDAMQSLGENVVLMIRCSEAESAEGVGLPLLGREHCADSNPACACHQAPLAPFLVC